MTVSFLTASIFIRIRWIYQPETDSSLRIIGYESDESGGYEIVAYQHDYTQDYGKYIFIDPVSGQIRKQLQI